jgi:hypothetical protein
MLCEICSKEFDKSKLCLDHHHESDQFRGNLCRSCNLLIGFAHEDEEVLLSAVEYLAFWRKERVEWKTARKEKTSLQSKSP